MTKKASRQAITKRIVKALEYFGKGDMEEALYNIAPVIDVIAKERFKDKKGVGERIKAFLFEEQSIIYNLSTQGRMPLKDGVKLVF